MFSDPWKIIGNFVIWRALTSWIGGAIGFVLVMFGAFCLQGDTQTDFVYGVLIGLPVLTVVALIVWGLCLYAQHRSDRRLLIEGRIARGVDPIKGFGPISTQRGLALAEKHRTRLSATPTSRARIEPRLDILNVR